MLFEKSEQLYYVGQMFDWGDPSGKDHEFPKSLKEHPVISEKARAATLSNTRQAVWVWIQHGERNQAGAAAYSPKYEVMKLIILLSGAIIKALIARTLL